MFLASSRVISKFGSKMIFSAISRALKNFFAFKNRHFKAGTRPFLKGVFDERPVLILRFVHHFERNPSSAGWRTRDKGLLNPPRRGASPLIIPQAGLTPVEG